MSTLSLIDLQLIQSISMTLANDLFVIGLLWVGNHCFLSWLPIGWANLSVLISKLEGSD